MRIGSEKDFFSGLLFIVVGAGFAWGATDFRIGEASQMGPGYFPFMLGVLLAVVGLFVLIQSIVVQTEDGEPIGSIAWKPVIFIILANFTFGVMIAGLPIIGIPYMGLLAAVVAVTFLASFAGDDFRIKEVLVLSVFLSLMSYIIFTRLLDLRLPALPAFSYP